MAEVRKRNMVERLDGRMVNSGQLRGMLFVCATGCCCGRTDRGYAAVDQNLYHLEWERRRLRSRVHLNQGGCLGPCVLANVVMVVIDGRPYWFHSVNDNAIVLAMFDYIELLLEDIDTPAPTVLLPHVFNGFAWNGLADTAEAGANAALSATLGEGVLFLSQSDTDLLALEKARTLLPSDFASLEAAHVGRLADDSAVDVLLQRLLPGAQVVVARLHSARSFEYGLGRLIEWAEGREGFLLCLPAVETFDYDLMARSNVGVPLAQAISAYFQCGGPQNLANGLKCLSDHLLVSGWGFDQPQALPLHGVYEPNTEDWVCDEAKDVDVNHDVSSDGDGAGALPHGTPTETERVALNGEAAAVEGISSRNGSTLDAETGGGQDQAKSCIGILFYRAHLLSGNTEFVDALAAEIERRGMEVRAVFTQSLKECDSEGNPFAFGEMTGEGPVDAIISTLSFALGDGGEAMSDLDVPVIQAITCSNDEAAWQRNGRGLGSLDTAMNVAIPEFDGRIVGVPVSFKEALGEGGTRYVPHPERIRRLASIVEKQIALRRKPNAEKRIAFVLTNSAAKAARVGNAVGLDAPASLLKLMRIMKEEGYNINPLPRSGDALLLELIGRCSYDVTWLEEAQLARAQKLPVDRYAEWFDTAPESNRADMVRQWGAAPGKAYIHGEAFALAGLEFGNAFVALQPPRGYDMDPDQVYHRPDLPPPHNYLALYRWLQHVWKADAIVHMGKHGTLEWLPGKSVGLSEGCFPDLILEDMPLVYPFIINDPGEGSQAKRRAHAIIVDHMTPPMTSAGAYGTLAELAQLADEYYTAEQLDPAKLPLLQRQIWETIQRDHLEDDLRYILRADHGDHTHSWDGAFLEDGTPTAFAELQGAQVAHLLEDIEGYLCELTGAQIRDGLHILGSVPEGDQLVETVYHLVKLPNADIPSLPACAASIAGQDWQLLLDRPGDRRDDDGTGLKTNADLVEWIESACKRALAGLAEAEWRVESVSGIAAETAGRLGSLQAARAQADSSHGGAGNGELEEILHYVTGSILPNLLEGGVAEIGQIVHALDGGYVRPGPSGSPSRGMAHVLPTGRNFFAVDPRALPTMASWQVGQGLAETLIGRYMREEGKFPESVGLSIWGTSAMRTAGDDIAQVLALLGARPVWQRENRRVTGVELISLEELGRPRVDVVCRISGFFRDAFPHLITLIDSAVQLAIEAKEPAEMNFPRQHALASEAALRMAGHGESAAEKARFRIFGCKPGSYGAGILPLIDAKNWQSDKDFARAYLLWGGYAYSQAQAGVPAEEEFARALSSVQVATKNQDNREHDIFDSDDYLQFHGGMIATVRALTGRNPSRYFGDSSDPDRVRTRDLREEARRVFRSRVVNPKWIESVQRHGYKGALEIAATVDYLFGYDATSQVLEDWMYQRLVEEFLRSESMQQFFSESNPWAWQAIAERLLEAVERDLWQDPDPQDIALLEAARELGVEEIKKSGRALAATG